MKALFIACFYFLSFGLFSQTTFWTEDFDGATCMAGSGCDPSFVAWTVINTGTNGSAANTWYVSATECGNTAGQCGTSCANDQSLHVGNVSSSSAAFLFCPGGDCGAAYDDSSPAEATDKRVESPTINCTGQSNISVNFNYIEKGQLTSDDATLWYYDGSTWTSINAIAKTGAGCGAQGLWTALSAALPASANNNPNVKIGFRWVNNGDGVATDPSFAVDDISLISVAPTLPTAQFSSSITTICVGNQITFTDQSTGGTPPYAYSWTFNGGTPGTANTAGPHAIQFNQSGNYTVSLTITDQNGDSDTFSQNIVVNDLPSVGANAFPSTTICQGDQITLSGTGATSYSWSGGVSDGVAFTPALGVSTYTVTGTINNCQNTFDVQITVQDCSVPTASFTASSTTVCEGETIVFTNISLGTNITTYSWDFGAAGIPATSSNEGPHTVTYTTAGTYTVSLTVSNANGTDSYQSTVTVLALPNVYIIAQPSDTICVGDEVTLTGSGAASFTWSSGIQNGISFTPSQLGSNVYTVIGEDVNGCQQSAQMEVFVGTCSNTPGFNIPDGVSPNGDGANDTWIISGLSLYPDAKVSVFNRWGQEVYSGTVSTPDWDGTDNGKELPIGDYYYLIDLGNGETYNGVVTLKR